VLNSPLGVTLRLTRSSPQMLQWFRGHNGDTKLSDTQQLFTRFRSKGVRLHYWP